MILLVEQDFLLKKDDSKGGAESHEHLLLCTIKYLSWENAEFGKKTAVFAEHLRKSKGLLGEDFNPYQSLLYEGRHSFGIGPRWQ